MKNTQRKSTSMKKTLLTMLATVICVSACAVGTDHHVVNLSPEDQMLKNKFRGIYGVVLRLDAATPKEYITMTSETGRLISGASLLSLSNVKNQTYTDNSMPIPKNIHAIWRTGVTADAGQGKWLGGTVVGDYTVPVPVAERIPDSILDYIRKNGGALRLKIRLKDDGILIGWDVERIVLLKDWKPGLGLHSGVNYLQPGGDFKEARPVESVFEDGELKHLPSSVLAPLSASDEALLKKYNLMLVKGVIMTNPPTPENYQRVWEKGWYLDKNGKKVFTDY